MAVYVILTVLKEELPAEVKNGWALHITDVSKAHVMKALHVSCPRG
jgi:hypothetical protein